MNMFINLSDTFEDISHFASVNMNIITAIYNIPRSVSSSVDM